MTRSPTCQKKSVPSGDTASELQLSVECGVGKVSLGRGCGEQRRGLIVWVYIVAEFSAPTTRLSTAVGSIPVGLR